MCKKQAIDEGKQIKRALKRVLTKKRPGFKVVDWSWRIGFDHSSKRSIYIEVRYKLTSKTKKLPPVLYSRLADKIHDAILHENIKPWPYVGFTEV